jgi:arginine-tRNA-protein transferase
VTRATTTKPRVIAPPTSLRGLGPLVVVDGECPYFRDGRTNRTAFALPGTPLGPTDYETAMHLGMRRSGALVYRPLCPTCRKCQPFRLDTERFVASKSQRRAQKRCDGLFTVDVSRPVSDKERLELYGRYQAGQHGADGQTADGESYDRFLCESVADTWELTWRDREGSLAAVGIIDVVSSGLSTVYCYWDPVLRDLSLGTVSALYEIELCREWGKRYYYLGYLVLGSQTMSYKAGFHGGEVWDGTTWIPLGSRDLEDEGVIKTLEDAEQASMAADSKAFRID